MISESDIIKNYGSDAANLIVADLYRTLVSKEDQKLLELAFAKKIEQSQLDEFLKDWDIEKYGERKSLMLSYVMKTNPELKFSTYEKPRLEGLLKYHRFRNLKLISHYSKIVNALNAENIFPMILKGGAMKHIRPDLSRPMGDIDILVPEQSEFLRACEICKNLGYVFAEFSSDHAVDVRLPNSEDGVIDLHRHIALGTNYNKEFLKDLFARALIEDVFRTESFVPCFEDLMFIGITNLARNLNSRTSIEGILYSLFDFKYLSESKPDFDWNLVLQNIVKTKTQVQALLAMKFINKIIPEMLPESLINNNKINRKFTKYCERIVFHHFYFTDLKRYYKKRLNIKNAFKNPKSMKDYLVDKTTYFTIKRVIRKSSFLVRIFLMWQQQKTKKI